MNKSSLDRLAKVHPALAEKVKAMAEALAKRGVTVEVVQGLRTFAEQDKLYAKGRTAPGNKVTNARGGQSNHNYGLAVDLCPFVKGQPDWNAKDPIWQMMGQEGVKVGLEWGGTWKSIVDKPHFQIPGLALKDCQALYAKGGLKAVWARASEIVSKK
jgi:peptidoglycan LD-endopeptidase CwlK